MDTNDVEGSGTGLPHMKYVMPLFKKSTSYV